MSPCFTVMVVKLQQVAQRCCGVSILEDSKNPTGHGSEQLSLGHPALSREVGLVDI